MEARWWVVHMTPLRRLRQKQVEDEQVDVMGYVGPYFPTFAIFNILDTKFIVVI
jgi:hypothetical protein